MVTRIDSVAGSVLPTDSEARKDIPLARGLIDYFPAALAAVARISAIGNAKHNPGEELHHARGKSADHADCLLRHFVDRGTYDSDGQLHDAKVAWRALALLQETLEHLEGVPLPRGARLVTGDNVDDSGAFKPGDRVEHRDDPKKPGTALYRDYHGDDDPYPVWLVHWDSSTDSLDKDYPSVLWHTEDTLIPFTTRGSYKRGAGRFLPSPAGPEAVVLSGE